MAKTQFNVEQFKTEAVKPLFAVAGATELAVELARGYATEAQKVTQDRFAEVQTRVSDVQARVQKAEFDTKSLQAQARTRVRGAARRGPGGPGPLRGSPRRAPEGGQGLPGQVRDAPQRRPRGAQRGVRRPRLAWREASSPRSARTASAPWPRSRPRRASPPPVAR